MQSSSGNYSMRHQVPMVSLLLLVYLSVVAYISVEMSLCSCWRRDILRVKGQALITNFNFLWLCVTNMQSSSGNYSVRHWVPMVFLLLLVLLLLLAFLAELSLGACWHRNIWRVKVVKKSLENSKNGQVITFTLALVDVINQSMLSSWSGLGSMHTHRTTQVVNPYCDGNWLIGTMLAHNISTAALTYKKVWFCG